MLNWCRKNELIFSQLTCEPLGDSTCPDYVLCIENKKVAIEVVQTEKGFTADDEDHLYKANDILYSFHKKMKDLKFTINKWISPHHDIYCELRIDRLLQKKQFMSFFKILHHEMRDLYEKNCFPHDWTSLDLKVRGVDVAIKLQRNEGKGSFVSFLMPSGTSLVPLQKKAELVLKICIDIKNEKMANLSFDEKWLIIVPQHPSLDFEDYKSAMKYIAKKCFSKIFIFWDDVSYEIG